MSDQPNASAPEASAPEAPKTQPTPAPAPAASQEATPPQQTEAFSREYVEQLRQEAAQHRTQRNEARQQLEQMQGRLSQMETTFQEQFKSQLAEIQTRLQEQEQKATKAEQEALRLQAVNKAGLPAEFAARLTGSTLEELTADAQQLAAMIPGTRSFKVGHGGQPAQANAADDILKRMTGGNPGAWTKADD